MTLLVVLDGRPLNRSLHARLARTVAEDVRSFGNALDALDWFAVHDADLVVTDFALPRLDAATFIRRLHALPGRETVPVLVITAAQDGPQRLSALEAGAIDFLRDPVDEIEFVTRCRNLLRLHRNRSAVPSGDSADIPPQPEPHDRPIRARVDSLAQVIDTVPAFISATAADGRIVFANAMHLADHEPPIGPDMADPAPCFDEDYRKRSLALDALVFRSGRPLPAFEQTVSAKDGGRRILLTTKSPLRDSGGAVDGVLTTSLDITGRKQLEQHLQHVASHDGLTDLPNRSMLQARLEALLEHRQQGSRVVVLHLLDLDRFRQVNDRLGHPAGDELLRAVACRLRQCVGSRDLVARICADEFAILQGSLSSPEDATTLARCMLDAMARPVPLGEQSVTVGVSIGISLSSVDTGGATEMLRHANLAMEQARDEGGNRLRFFVPDMDRRHEHRLRLQGELQRALERDELLLHYQPQMNLRTSRVCGMEALLRWNHPVRGLMMPGEFLPIAEEAGMMGGIDEWVLHRACREAASWTRSGIDAVRVGVNISPVRISEGRTRDAISAALRDSGLPPSRLEIELTERDLVADLDGVGQALGELRATGVQVAIDDFGVGYSFLGHVKALPADRIKIDQSFIRNMLTDEGDATIVRAVVAMAHGLRLGVVAEGVETVEQFTQLAMEGCDDIQGYYVSRPLPLPDLAERLQAAQN